MERCKNLGHEVKTCIVVEHLPRLSVSQNRNGTTKENGDTSPEKNKVFDNKVTIKYSLQINLKFIDLTQGCPASDHQRAKLYLKYLPAGCIIKIHSFRETRTLSLTQMLRQYDVIEHVMSLPDSVVRSTVLKN
jgi:hypothetical protein